MVLSYYRGVRVFKLRYDHACSELLINKKKQKQKKINKQTKQKQNKTKKTYMKVYPLSTDTVTS